jgi:hypothetical protein
MGLLRSALLIELPAQVEAAACAEEKAALLSAAVRGLALLLDLEGNRVGALLHLELTQLQGCAAPLASEAAAVGANKPCLLTAIQTLTLATLEAMATGPQGMLGQLHLARALVGAGTACLLVVSGGLLSGGNTREFACR